MSDKQISGWRAVALLGLVWLGMACPAGSCWIPAKFIEITEREMSSCHSGTKETLNEATQTSLLSDKQSQRFRQRKETHG